MKQMRQEECAIEVINLVKKYKNFELKQVSFQVPKGSIVGFVGENGAGKSTTIKEILNIIQKDAGEIKVFGMDNQLEEKKLKEEIGVVFDECCFHESLYVKDLAIIMKQVYSRWDKVVFEKYINQFSLPTNKLIKEFSRGMKMKLSIAVALSHHAKLLILDEATSGLDPIIRDEILDIFLEFIQDEEHTIFISSHIISDLEKIADYIVFIHKGSIRFCESKDDLLYQYGVMRCSEDNYVTLDKKHVMGTRKYQYGVEVLVDNKKEMEKENKDCIIDQTSIEEIILFMVKGENGGLA